MPESYRAQPGYDLTPWRPVLIELFALTEAEVDRRINIRNGVLDALDLLAAAYQQAESTAGALVLIDAQDYLCDVIEGCEA